jgi:hypothetical protein
MTHGEYYLIRIYNKHFDFNLYIEPDIFACTLQRQLHEQEAGGVSPNMGPV